jgi:hypothetical protein
VLRQIVQSVAWNLDVVWPPPFSYLINALSLFSFDFLSLECVRKKADHYTSVYLWAVTPIALSALNVLVYGARRFLLQPPAREVTDGVGEAERASVSYRRSSFSGGTSNNRALRPRVNDDDYDSSGSSGHGLTASVSFFFNFLLKTLFVSCVGFWRKYTHVASVCALDHRQRRRSTTTARTPTTRTFV